MNKWNLRALKKLCSLYGGHGGAMRLMIVIGLISLFSISAYSSINPNLEIEDLKGKSPFDPIVQKHVFLKVLEKMNLKESSNIVMPKIRVSESIFPHESNIINASESQGMPGWAFEKGINIFLIDLNTIVLGKNMKINNLAHEYAHFVQMHYKQYERRDFAMDYVEEEAIEVQNHFRE